ncbi:M23 family metallopeptidase [Marinobacter fonticola]|uniref:M23 family metallopeptidase n=1 Tax=Marinobacter fonticola TaxID=2603215 RepID=UPI001D0D9F09|nr:M23 family metallopeptidase [Marinobacter fonticola]
MPESEQPDRTGAPRRRRWRPWLLFLVLVALVVLLVLREDLRRQAETSAVRAVRVIAIDGLGFSPRDIFLWRLRIAGLADSPLGQQWKNAVSQAGTEPVTFDRQYQAQRQFSADAVEAHIYQVTLQQGAELNWRLERSSLVGGDLFASLERRDSDGEFGTDDWSTVTELEATGQREHLVVEVDGTYRIVLQPELFASVDYALALASGGSLAFPVSGASQRDIGSPFGAPRDGGARSHHGVDIFASRGTPVTAVTDGRARTGTSNLGGKHVWLSGSLLGFGTPRYYYAHLDAFEVASGADVKQGDILGYVGNTGNARTTPPHLHFGIYTVGGPVDPDPFLRPRPDLPTQ